MGQIWLMGCICLPLLLLLLSCFSHVWLCDPIDSSPPGSTVPGILQARILEWVAISFSNAWKWKVKVKSLSKCLTLRDPMDCSPPGSSVHGIFQARVLEWVVIAFSAKSRLNPIHSTFFHIFHGWDAFHVHDISVKWQNVLANVQPKHFNHLCALLRSFTALEQEGELYDVKNCCNWQKTGPKLA